MKVSPELEAHRQWLGQIGQVGLVVSPAVLVKHGVVIDRQRAVEVQTTLTELSSDDEHPRMADPLAIFRGVLGWRDDFLAGTTDGPDLPDTLVAALPEHEVISGPRMRSATGADGWMAAASSDRRRGRLRQGPAGCATQRLACQSARPVGTFAA
jgi:hypothetical protein